MPRIISLEITERSGSKARDGSTSITIVYTVITDTVASLEFVYNHPQTPKENVELASHRGYYWERIDPKQIKPLVWELTCVATPFQLDPIEENPLARAAIVTCDGSLVVEPTNFDWKGRPMTTTAGEFIGGIERERPVLTYHVQKNIANDPPWMEAYLGAVNLDPVKLRGLMRPAGTLKLVNPNLGAYEVENRTRFCVLTFDLQYDPLGHRAERWNAGTLKMRAVPLFDGARVRRNLWVQERILAGNPQQPVESPVFLNIRGEVIEDFLKPSDDGRPVDVSKLVKLKFDVQPQRVFTGTLPLT